jgi:hypothetical protein
VLDLMLRVVRETAQALRLVGISILQTSGFHFEAGRVLNKASNVSVEDADVSHEDAPIGSDN